MADANPLGEEGVTFVGRHVFQRSLFPSGLSAAIIITLVAGFIFVKQGILKNLLDFTPLRINIAANQ
jgi:hypothetical protein